MQRPSGSDRIFRAKERFASLETSAAGWCNSGFQIYAGEGRQRQDVEEAGKTIGLRAESIQRREGRKK